MPPPNEVSVDLSINPSGVIVGTDRVVSELNRPIGVMEQLKINSGDLKNALDRAVDPGQIKVLNRELQQTQQEMSHLEGKATPGMTREFRQARLETAGLSQGLLGLLFITESMQGERYSAEFRKITDSIRGGAQAAVGTSFAVSMLGGELAALAGPIGIVVGLGAGLIAFFNNTNEAAKKAGDEGLRQFSEKIGNFSPERLETIKLAADALVSQTESKLLNENAFIRNAPSTKEAVSHFDRAQALKEELKTRKELLKAITDQIAKTAELNALNAATDQILKGAQTTIGQNEDRIEALKKQRANTKEPSLIRAMTDEIEKLQDENKKLLKSTKDLQDERDKAIKKENAEIEKRNRAEEEEGKKRGQAYDRYVELQYNLERDTLGKTTNDRLKAIQLWYDEEKRQVTKLAEESGQTPNFANLNAARDRRVFDERVRSARELAKTEKASLDQQISDARLLGELVQKGFGKAGNELVSALETGLSIVEEMDKVWKQMNTESSIFNVLGKAFGIISTVAAGGIDAPKLIGNAFGDRAARRAQNTSSGGVNIYLQGTLEGQTFLRKEYPAYDTFARKEKV